MNESQMTDPEWDRMITGLREGDQQTCSDFWNQYGDVLQGVAQKQLSQRLQRRVGSDDVVQSACRTFFRRISAGQFELPDADALWRLMCAITLTKARRAARDHSRQKRGFSQEQYLDATNPEGEERQYDLPSNQQNPLDAAQFSDQMDKLLQNLSPEECQIVDLKLQNHTNEEIATILKCSERTVRRMTEKVRQRWTTIFDDAE